MPGVIYDSGWVPVASGAINTTQNFGSAKVARITLAASGTNGAAASSITWLAGTNRTPYPAVPAVTGGIKVFQSYPSQPLVTGTYTVANPGANAANRYVLGDASGTMDGLCPATVRISLTAGAASSARVIVETDV